MISFPIVKINIGLNIIAKRKDGYHEICSLFYPVPVKDILEIVPAQQMKWETAGLSIPGNEKENLVWKAYELLKEDFDIPPVSIFLYKNIPMGGGLGGGSSNGAETLKMLNELFELGLTTQQLKEKALKLGSDCPFFIDSTPQLVKGRGDVLSPFELDLKGKYLVLINNGTHINTADAYGRVNPQTPVVLLENELLLPVEKWRNNIVNDFEAPTFAVYSALKKIKSQLYELGATYASLTGSGSTLFGIFNESPDLKNLFDFENGFVKTVEL